MGAKHRVGRPTLEIPLGGNMGYQVSMPKGAVDPRTCLVSTEPHTHRKCNTMDFQVRSHLGSKGYVSTYLVYFST
ncbi:unnamed protein product [Boreogadus saida]